MLTRRYFLTGASATTIASLLPGATLKAAHFSASPATTTTIAQRSVINGFDEAGGNSFPFINFAKAMGLQGAGAPFQTLMNTDGYPKGSLSGTGGYGSLLAVDPALLSSSVTWVLSWQGMGGIQVSNGTTYGQTNFVVTAGSSFVGGSSIPYKLTNVMMASGLNGYVEFTNGPGASQLGLGFTPYIAYDGSMSNVQLYRKSDQAALKSGKIFAPEFLGLLRSLNTKIVRTMDWGSTNGSNVSRFAYRASLSAFSYYNVRWNSSLWGGTTSGSSAAYVCANPSGSGRGGYQDGETVQVQFHAANSTVAPTLNVGGRGAVPIKLNYAAPLSPGSISANTCGTLVYDAWLNAWLADFSIVAANNVNGGLTTGVPIEIQVALCNELGADLWYNFPFHYDDASCAAAATYVRDNLNPNLKAYFEYSNEVWNWIMPQTSLAAAKGAYLGFPNSSNRQVNGYYALRVRQIMTAVTSAWSPRSTKTLRRVLALWEADGDPKSADMYRLRGGDLDTRLSYSNYNSVVGESHSSGGPLFTRPIDVCDTISYATYYSGPNLGNNTGDLSGLNATDVAALKLAADNYATGSATGNQALIASALAWVDNDIRRGSTQKLSVTIGNDQTTLTAAGTAPAVGTAVMFTSMGTLPTGLSSTSVFYVVKQSGGTFQISTSFGGTVLGSITGGAGSLYVGSLGWETLLWHKTFYYADPNSRGFGLEQIAASYDGFRPPSYSNIYVECYEGGLETLPSTQNQCSAVGLNGATYGTASGTGGAIYKLLQGYKNSPLAKQLVLDQFSQFMGYPHSATPAWYAIQGYSQWSLMSGDTFSPPYQLFNGVASYNSGT